MFDKLRNKFKLHMQKYGYMLPEKSTMGFMGSLALKVKKFGEDSFYD